MKKKFGKVELKKGKRKNFLSDPKIRLLIEGIAVIFIISILIYLIFFRQKEQTEDLKEGIAYIENLEAVDTASTEQKIKDIKKAERKAAFESGEMDVWQQFDDTVILGDSRAVGFEYHEFIPDDRVIAEGGATIRNIPDYVESVKSVNPSTIILCFGLNDISIGYWDTVEEYIGELDEMITLLKDSVPGANVFVNSIIPAIDPAFELSEKWRSIPDWNAAIKSHCEETGIPYIDVTSTVEEHQDLYDPDGHHMMKEFYEYWAIAMVTEVNEYES